MINKELDLMLREETEFELECKAVPGTPQYCILNEDNGTKVVTAEDKDLFLHDNIFINKHPRYEKMEAHKHSFVEINYMYSGSCIQYVDGQRIILKEGQLLLMDKETVHRILPLEENDILVNILLKHDTISTDILSQIVQSQSMIFDFLKNAAIVDTDHKHHLILETEDNEYVQYQLQSLIREFYNQDKYSDQTMKLLLSLIFIELSRHLESQTLRQAAPAQSELILILGYMDKHYNNLTLKELAEQFGYNPNYLSNKLKTETKLSFSQLIERKKLSMAMFYIRENVYSMEEIAHKIGYESPSAFFKLFKKYYKITPLQYKKNQETNENSI
jgi:AraC-like DNA-binding protein/mannose-6-phosphate isomerase-like protein (cupin superfamily)